MLITALISLPSAALATAEPTDGLWTPAPGVDASTLTLAPEQYGSFDLDLSGMSDLLAEKASTKAMSASHSTSAERTITVPAPDGSLVAFRVQPKRILADQLAGEHPEIRAFVGRGVDDAGLTIRADLTPLGFHAMVRSSDNSTRAWFVDPAVVGETGTYVSYPAGSLPTPRLTEVDDVDAPSAAPEVSSARAADTTVKTRTLRVAFSSDPSFATFYGSDNVLAAKATILNRDAGVYNDDLGVELVLADGTDRLNFDTDAAATEPNGPCGADACFTPGAFEGCNGDTLNQNAAVVQRLLGDAQYDLGHILLGHEGGGLAYVGVVGEDYWKGGGCTGSAKPAGDGFAIDYVAHELGHQVGANHTYNACDGSSDDTAVEPGSGSTIMAYAGICRADDLQPRSDAYFSQRSIDEIHRTIDDRFPGADSGNAVPVVSAPADRTIPVRTPFALTAEGSDAEGPLSYLWEQNDVGDPDRHLFDDGKTAGPLFRVFGTYVDTSSTSSQYYSPGRHEAGSDPTRTFPDLAQILSGHTNAVTGTCDPSLTGVDKIECYSEFLPTEAYAGPLNFRVTARDADPRGGGTAHADVRLAVDDTAGPLLVDGLESSDAPYLGGSRHTVHWKVNGTDAAALAPRVRLLLSTDGGQTFPTVLTDSTPNDGEQEVLLPNVDTTEARVKVEAVDNYFFAIQATPFTISARAAAPTVTVEGEAYPGSTVSLTGTGFLPGESVSLSGIGSSAGQTVVADADGVFHATIAVPADAVLGTVTIEAAGVKSSLVATAALTVVAAPAPTPTPTPTPTGSSSPTPAPAGASSAPVGASRQGGALALTGAPMVSAVAIGAALIGIAGGVVLLAARRRRAAVSDAATE